MDATRRFAQLITRPVHEVPLDEVALLIAAHAYPSLDVVRQRRRLDLLADRCPKPALEAVVAYLFVDLGFAGNRHDYYDPRNSYLNDVLDRRTGIPISLAVLAMEVGRRVGVSLVGVGMPGHFLLRDALDDTVFVDPFGRGRMLDRGGCEAAFHSVHGERAAFDPAFLDPVDTPRHRRSPAGQPAGHVRVPRRPGGAGVGTAPAHPRARHPGRGARRAGVGAGGAGAVRGGGRRVRHAGRAARRRAGRRVPPLGHAPAGPAQLRPDR